MGGMTLPATLSGLQSDSVSVQLATQQVWFVTDKAGRIVRAGIPAQKLAVTRADGIAASKLGSQPDYSAPAGAPYTAENVTVPTGFGHTLGGTFTKPTAAVGKLPAVISITGSGAQDRDEYIGIVPKGYRPFRQLADTLGRIGIAMLRMDDRGYGASGGSFAAATSRDFANDIRAGIAWLRTRSDVDPKRIFLAGHSEGGLIAPMVAVDEPSLAGIVLMAGPARTGREILLFQVRYGIEHDTSITGAKRGLRTGTRADHGRLGTRLVCLAQVFRDVRSDCDCEARQNSSVDFAGRRRSASHCLRSADTRVDLQSGWKSRCDSARFSRIESLVHSSAGWQSVRLCHSADESRLAGNDRHARRVGAFTLGGHALISVVFRGDANVHLQLRRERILDLLLRLSDGGGCRR